MFNFLEYTIHNYSDDTELEPFKLTKASVIKTLNAMMQKE